MYKIGIILTFLIQKENLSPLGIAMRANPNLFMHSCLYKLMAVATRNVYLIHV